MTFLFETQEAFAEHCAQCAIPGAFKQLQADRVTCVNKGITAVEAGKRAEDIYRSMLQGTGEIDARIRARSEARDKEAVAGMKEAVLNPAFDSAGCADELARLDRVIQFDRNAVAFGRAHLIPAAFAKKMRTDATVAGLVANLAHLDALIAGVESMIASEKLTEIEGVSVFMPEGSRTHRMYEDSRRAFQTALMADEAATAAEKRAEALAQAGGAL